MELLELVGCAHSSYIAANLSGDPRYEPHLININ